MTDYRPGEDGPVAPTRREPRIWPILVIFSIVALGGLAWIFKLELFSQSAMTVPSSSSDVADTGEKPDTRFGDLYQRYGMAPVAASVASGAAVNADLTTLQKEPCDKQVVYKASVTLEHAHAMRAAAEMLRGFSSVCGDANNELYRASELFFLLGDYDAAIRASNDVIRLQPDAQNAYFVRARAEQGRQQYAAAVDDYVTLIRLLPDLKRVRSEVFTRMSDSYEKLGLACEAIMPLQTYMAIDPERRTTLQLERRMAALAAKGNCGEGYAKGTTRIARHSAGVLTARAEINGVTGTFLIDTGASFVTLSPSFAARAKLAFVKADHIDLRTGNGNTKATLVTVDAVKLAGLSAAGVPALVISKEFGGGVDGLLGMSFLSRFAILIEDGQMTLAAKVLKTEE